MNPYPYPPDPRAVPPQPQPMPQQFYAPPQGQMAPPPPAAPPPVGYPPVYPPAGYVPAPYYYAPPFTAAPKRDPRLAGAAKTLNRMCLLVLLQSAVSFVWEILFLGIMSLLHVSIYTDALAYQWHMAALVPLTTALPFFVYLLTKRREADQYLRFEKVGAGAFLLCVVGGLCVCLLGNYPAIAIQNFFSNFGYQPAPDVTSSQASWPVMLLELFCTAVVVPVMEEFAFRGVLLSSLRRYGAGFAIAGSALVFSLVHLDFSNVVFALIAGLVFGYLYVRTENLWITICIHALNNGIAVLGSYGEFLFGSGQAAEVFDIVLTVTPLVLGAAALLIAVLRRRDLFSLKRAPRQGWPAQPLNGGEAASSIVRTPLFWAIVAFMVLYTVTLFLQ